MGWDLGSVRSQSEQEDGAELDVPVSPRRRPRRKSLGPSFFSLSGGIMKRDPRTANRIDALLTRMMEQETPAPYSAHVERNLDYLYTSLQLDMISMVAEEYRLQDDDDLPPPPPED